MRRAFLVALLTVASVWGSPAVGKETKWAMWGSTGGSKSGGGSWWAGMQNGATSFFASTRNIFASGGSSTAAAATQSTSRKSFGTSRSTQPWFSGSKPRTALGGGGSSSASRSGGIKGWK